MEMMEGRKETKRREIHEAKNRNSTAIKLKEMK